MFLAIPVLQLCDVSSLQSIRTFASEYVASGRPIHALINNAGLMVHDGQRSADGYDLNFATNTLGTWALTRALAPALKRSAPARVIFVSSGGALTESLHVDGMEGPVPGALGKTDGTVQYARDKRRQVGPAMRCTGMGGVAVHSILVFTAFGGTHALLGPC